MQLLSRFGIISPAIAACLMAGQLSAQDDICSGSNGAVIALVPASATGEHTIGALDNVITLAEGGQRVFLDMLYCGWDRDLDGWPSIKTLEIQFDMSGFSNGVSPSDLAYAIEPCTTQEECESIFGYDSGLGGDCEYLDETACRPLFMDWSRPDWEGGDLPACETSTGRCGYATLLCGDCPIEDDGTVRYLATVVLDVPPDAIGQFTIPMVPEGCFMKDIYSGGIPIVELRGPVIQIAGGCCLPSGSCNDFDPQACVDAGGEPTHLPCQGDCDGTGIDDACETFEDCNGNNLPDACDIDNGVSFDSNLNGVPDECEFGACCACPPDSGCEDTSLAGCDEVGGTFAAEQACASVTCPTAAPSNDDCTGAFPISDGFYALEAFDTRCTTTDGPATATGDCAFSQPDAFRNDIWFEFVPACDYRTSITVIGADYDAYVAVYCNGSDSCSCPTDASTEYACGQVVGEGNSVDFPVTAGNCYTIRVGGFAGAEGTGALEIACYEVACYLPNAPEPEPTVPDIGHGTRNRYLSLQINDPGRQLALRVKPVDLPPPFEAWEGETYWIGEPFEVTEASCCNNPTPPPTFMAARLQCDPHFMDWTAVGPVHVLGSAVVPNATYDIQAVDSWCYILPTMCSDGYGFGDESLFSLPLTIGTSRWGDLVDDCGVTPCTSPDGVVDFLDISAVVEKFRNLPGATFKSRADIAPELPDLVIDFIDISHAVEAFRGEPYPFDGPVGCPP